VPRAHAIAGPTLKTANLQAFFSDAPPAEKIDRLRRACEAHVRLTKECSKGLGQDRHLYALYCLLRREAEGREADEDAPPSPTSSASDPAPTTSSSAEAAPTLPAIFRDPGWALLSTSIMSTSNCGNPALRLFGFGPVAADGYGIGYIIKEDGVSVCASSKHLQTRRFLETLRGYLLDVQRALVQHDRAANARPEPFVDHAGILRDAKTGRPIAAADEIAEDEEEVLCKCIFISLCLALWLCQYLRTSLCSRVLINAPRIYVRFHWLRRGGLCWAICLVLGSSGSQLLFHTVDV
jgi:carnitine O-acetyltransferase